MKRMMPCAVGLILALMGGHLSLAGGGAREPVKPPPAPKFEKRTEALEDRPKYGYTCLTGSFDLSKDGLFQYVANDSFYVRKVVYYKTDGNYYYFYEADFPKWQWAFPINRTNGFFEIWYTGGSDQHMIWNTNAFRGNRP